MHEQREEKRPPLKMPPSKTYTLLFPCHLDKPPSASPNSHQHTTWPTARMPCRVVSAP